MRGVYTPATRERNTHSGSCCALRNRHRSSNYRVHVLVTGTIGPVLCENSQEFAPQRLGSTENLPAAMKPLFLADAQHNNTP